MTVIERVIVALNSWKELRDAESLDSDVGQLLTQDFHVMP